MSMDVGSNDYDDGRSSETGRITLTSIQMALIRVESSLATMRTDIHYIRESQMQKSNENERRFIDQETRLRALEGKRYLEPKSVTTVFAIVLPIVAIGVSIIAIITK
jgi:hypothetical protein